MKVAVLGAGYMGSAITFPLADNDIVVNLWGTWLDDDIISMCRAGDHPKLKKPLHGDVNLFTSDQLQQAVQGADAVFMAVSSEGFVPVFSKFIECKDVQDIRVFTLTKGLVDFRNTVERISRVAAIMYEEKHGRKIFWASVGGPVKAPELANSVPSLSIYGLNYSKGFDANGFNTSYYRIITTDDVCGVELCSCFKNVYAITSGIVDGLYSGQIETMYHNFSALLFNQAINEIKEIVVASGANAETVYSPACVGDLYVTAQSGRNRKYGELVGKGIDPEKAYRKMYSSQEIAEGYNALKLGYDYVKSLKIENRLPLLGSLYDIVYRCADARKTLTDFVAGF